MKYGDKQPAKGVLVPPERLFGVSGRIEEGKEACAAACRGRSKLNREAENTDDSLLSTSSSWGWTDEYPLPRAKPPRSSTAECSHLILEENGLVLAESGLKEAELN